MPTEFWAPTSNFVPCWLVTRWPCDELTGSSLNSLDWIGLDWIDAATTCWPPFAVWKVSFDDKNCAFNIMAKMFKSKYKWHAQLSSCRTIIWPQISQIYSKSCQNEQLRNFAKSQIRPKESSAQGCQLALVPYGQMQLNLRPKSLKKGQTFHLLHRNVDLCRFHDFYSCIVQFAQNCINEWQQIS